MNLTLDEMQVAARKRFNREHVLEDILSGVAAIIALILIAVPVISWAASGEESQNTSVYNFQTTMAGNHVLTINHLDSVKLDGQPIAHEEQSPMPAYGSWRTALTVLGGTMFLATLGWCCYYIYRRNQFRDMQVMKWIREENKDNGRA
jgi:hypothetical protein